MHSIRKIVGAVLRKELKNLDFGPIWARNARKPENRIFPEKSGSVSFLGLLSPNFVPKIRKIVRANSEKKSKKTHFRPFWALFAQIWANGIFPEKSFFAKNFLPLIRFVLAHLQPKLMT